MLADNLGDMGFVDHTYAVVGMLADKDSVAVLSVLKGRVAAWYLTSLQGPRGTSAECLAEVITSNGLGGEIFCFDSPAAAMRAARGRAAESDRILVFGSFYTVAGVRDLSLIHI